MGRKLKMKEQLKNIAALIPKIKEYDEDLEKQSLWWTVVAMVGKVNNQDMEPQLLDSIAETQEQFSKLKDTLIDSLVKRYVDKLSVEMALKSQALIEILNRNLFERTADVGFLAMDDEVISFMVEADFSENPQAAMRQNLVEYVQKYSVYDDVVLLTPSLDVAVRLKEDCDAASVVMTEEIKQALDSNDYVESDQPVSGLTFHDKPLTFYQKIVSNGQTVGLLCLCFKFEDEFERISNTLINDDCPITFILEGLDGHGIFSSKPEKISLASQAKIDCDKMKFLQLDREPTFVFTSVAKGYQGYKGLSWESKLMMPAKRALQNDTLESEIVLNDQSALFPHDLNELNLEINTALLIVILNGKIISLKNKVKAFLPVLDSFQEIGADIARIFLSSIEHIQQISYQTISTEVEISSRLSADIMDRNLYERANDSRWWALNRRIRTVLSNPLPTDQEKQEITELLKSINELYTVYTNIFVYDQAGEIVAMSADSPNLLGKRLIDLPEVRETLANRNSQHYAVSEFTKTPLYDNAETYIYHASVQGIESDSAVGGVGVVFDSTPEFKAILDDCLPKQINGERYENSFSTFVDRRGMIISITDNHLNLTVGDTLPVNADILGKENGSSGSENVLFDGVDFLAGYQVTKGYREYKVSDNYQNDVIALAFVPC